jgi:NADPH-dependent 2,4-dienoyl-CoA reductase/sulfur reductase-like enzyme
MIDPADNFDVLVIGAGPAGIAAAVTAAESGRRVGLVDEAPFAGGQIWRNRGEPAKSASARKWLARLNAAGSVAWLRQSRIVARPGARTVLLDTATGPRLVQGSSVILATGARELFLPFPGWTSPGVFGAGGIQALLKQGFGVAGKRVIVAGTGPLLLAVADLLRSSGAQVPLIIEQAPASRINRFALLLFRTPAKLLDGVLLRSRLLGSRYCTDSYPLRVSPVTAGRSRFPLLLEFREGNSDESAECDYLACGFNLIPNTEIPQIFGCEITGNGFVRVDGSLRTTVTNVFAAGELTGIGGVDKAIVEGRIAAYAAVGDAAAVAGLTSARAKAMDFAARLEATFALRPELLKLAQPDTIVCRCEDVPLGKVTRAISGRDAKLQTRCGMGPCQGRVCGPILQRLIGVEPPQVRPPVFATTIGTLAATQGVGSE